MEETKHSSSLGVSDLCRVKNSPAGVVSSPESNRAILEPSPMVPGEESTEKKKIDSGSNSENSKTAFSDLICSSDNKSVQSRDPLLGFFEANRRPEAEWDFRSAVFYGCQDLIYEPELFKKPPYEARGLYDDHSPDTRDNWWDGSYHY